MTRRIVIILLAALLSTAAMAGDFSKTGTAGAQFLKIGVGSRYNGMGEACVATADDIYSMYWNPAGLTYVPGSEIAFSYVNYVADISLNYVAYARKFNDIGVFGVSATVLSMSDQEITTVEQPEGTGLNYSVSSYALQVSYARQLTAQFSFGTSFKYINERIYHEDANGFAFDFGTLLYTGYKTLRLAMNISNMGPDMKFEGPDLDVPYDPDQSNPNQDPYSGSINVDPYHLPLIFRVGLAYDFEFNNDSKLVMSVEVKHPNDNQQQGAIGAEYNWQDRYFLRAGYKLNYEEENVGLGAGFRTGLGEETDLVLDYAWVDYGRLDTVHRFSASIAF